MNQDQPTSQDAAQAPEAQQKVEPDTAQGPDVKDEPKGAQNPDVKVQPKGADQPPKADRQKKTAEADPQQKAEETKAPDAQDEQAKAAQSAAPPPDVRRQRRAAQNPAPSPEAREQRRTASPQVSPTSPPARKQRRAAPESVETPKAPKSQPPKSPTSPVTKAIQTAAKILTSVFNVIKKPIVGSKVYTDNKAKFDSGWQRVQPLVKIVRWLWQKVLRPFWTKVVQPLWGKILELLRPRLPEPLQALSDRILTAIILAPFVLVWWLISSLTSTAPVAQAPPPPVVSAPKPAPVQPPEPISKAPEASEPSEAPAIVEEPVEPLPAEPAEPQKVVLSVQQQVAQISDRYSTDLIPQVQADFEADRLVVQVSDRWYDLSSTEQDELGLDVLQRSDGLDFKALEFRDLQGQLVARDPVVGPRIIVLRRHQI